MPRRAPAFRLAMVQIDETCCDKHIDDSAGVSVTASVSGILGWTDEVYLQVHNEVVCWPSGRSHKNNDSYEPV